MFGGVALAGGAALAACARETPPPPALTGDVPEVPETTTTTNPGGAEMNRVLLRTAQSLELVAVATYDTLLDSEFLAAPAVTQLFQRLQAQHREHVEALSAPIREAGGTPVTTPNEFLTTTVVQPLIEAIVDEETVLIAAHDVENALTQTWVESAGIFSTAELREFAMTIGGAEARNLTALNLQLGYTPVPLPLIRTGAALDPKGRLEA
jgi:hypothetical protein